MRSLLAALCVALAALPAQAVTIFAAASLKEALDAQARAYEAARGHGVIVSYAASNALARQIEAGAPADLFISADTEWVDYVEQKGFARPGVRVNLLRNELVLIAPAASPAAVKIAPGFALAAALGAGRLAMANPDAVPAGKYGKAALRTLGAWNAVASRIAPVENVRAALVLVSRGEAPLGIVYRTDALADKGVRIVDTFPADSHPPIVYPMILLRGRQEAAARDFARWLAAPESRAIWERFGFRRD